MQPAEEALMAQLRAAMERALKAMAEKARLENERLEARIAALEAKISERQQNS